MTAIAKELCRLCMEPCSMDVRTCRSIQDPELHCKLTSVFLFELPIENSLPNVVCSDCVHKVSDWYSYHETVQLNQHQLKEAAIRKEEPKSEITLESVKLEIHDDNYQDEQDPVASEEVDEEIKQEDDYNVDSDSSESSEEPAPKRTKRKYTKRSALDVEKKKPDEARIQRTKEENIKIREFFKLTCEVCSETFDELYRLQQHTQKKHNVRASIKCCNRVMYKKCRIIEHIDAHVNPNQFHCELCNKSYKTKYYLDLHNVKSHSSSEEKPFKCEKCHRSFPKAFLLRAHLQTHVQAECTICHKLLASAFTLRCHMEIMHGERASLVCETCGQEFRTKLGLERHILRHQGVVTIERVQCHICSKWVSGRQNLKTHVNIMHSEKNKPVTCNICKHTYPNVRAMASHKRRVHVEEKFECEFCGKKFKRKIYLKEHRASHTGQILYSCDVCGMTTNSNGNLYSHKKSKHPEQWMEAKKKAIELAYG